MKFNLVWAINALAFVIFWGLNSITRGNFDGLGIMLVFGPLFFVVGGVLGLKCENDGFGRKSRNYWITLVVLLILSTIGFYTIGSWVGEMQRTQGLLR
ncbi:hypothetical protein [Cerasicoccus frondis]|uniref:hypothetical protein n=1 Tax=Cerasicoccus frondis TaxID=490090 RepID=UPI00285279F9|nr:hypothetical protein [Cerasicoccus frondis]